MGPANTGSAVIQLGSPKSLSNRGTVGNGLMDDVLGRCILLFADNFSGELSDNGEGFQSQATNQNGEILGAY